MTSIISNTLDAYARSASKVWSHDRLNTVGASEVGQCARKVYWLKNEDDPKYRAPRDPDFVETWGARVRGTVIEDAFWQPAMKAKFGDRLLYSGKDQKTFVSDFLSATPDGVVVDLTDEEKREIGVDTDCVTLECKSADPRTNLAEAKSANIFQTQVQMGLIRELTPLRPTHSVLSYIDASFWNEVREFVIPFNETSYEVAKERATLIMTATSIAEVKPEGWIAGGRECNYCPFTIACGIERRNLPFQDVGPPVEPQFVAEMTDLARELRDAKRERDMDEALIRDLETDIKTRLREKGVKKIPGVLSWSEVKGRQAYDNKALKQAAIEAGVDVEQFSTVGEKTDRLLIQID
jgi:hypothetical protein